MSSDHDGIDFHQHVLGALNDPVGFVRRFLAADGLLQHGGIMAFATIASGGLNYAYQVYMGRALGPEQYGVFGALFALFYLVRVLGRGIMLCATRFVAELDGDAPAVAAFQRGLLVRSLLFSAGLFVLLAAASPLIGSFLDLESPWLVVAVAATVPFGLALTANQGTLQGLQWFGMLGSYRVAEAGLKLALGIAFVTLGYGVYGAFGGVLVAGLVVLVATTVHLGRRLTVPAGARRRFDHERTYRFALPAVLAGFCITVPTTVDVIFVKHFFASEQAGLYTAVSVLGKILLFMAMAISAALFPKVSNSHAAERPERLNALFDRAVLYTALVAGAGTFVYWAAPQFVLGRLFGPAYVDAVPLLRWYGLAIFAFVLAVIVLNFQLARDRTWFVYGFTALSFVEIGLMWAAHASMTRIIQVMLGVNAFLFVCGAIAVKIKL